MSNRKDKYAMSLFCHPGDPNTHGRFLAELLLIGGVQLETLAEGNQKVRFQEWSKAVQNATAGSEASPTDDHLKWLWETLITEPRIVRELGARISFREDERKDRELIDVLNSGHRLGVFLKSFTSFGAPVLSVPSELEPDGIITLRGKLMMGPGKAGRFECRDVKATVEIPVKKAESLDQEAVLMKLERIDVTVQRNMVMVWVRSLNHAFTVTSRRLQPHRRGHGGRIYDHIAWRNNNQWVSLEDIRRDVEAGKWKVK
jgi:hypothetical protein